ncbi:MAG: 50S ribosomal protein L35 [Candidatus Liptonbacteria bacterium]|nr:50S ribosomal protein L35 [Candidatus Liptonbacteria bacterium]
MQKSFIKRIKLTKRGKFMRRPMSVNHFRTRKSTKNLRDKRKRLQLDYPAKKLLDYAAAVL